MSRYCSKHLQMKLKLGAWNRPEKKVWCKTLSGLGNLWVWFMQATGFSAKTVVAVLVLKKTAASFQVVSSPA